MPRVRPPPGEAADGPVVFDAPPSSSGQPGLTIAVEGCCHGELDKIYETLLFLQEQENRKVDLLLCCGDFQAVRNLDDLECLACPPKYRSMQSFYKYYSGEAVAPIPTIFIGGNHEAINHLRGLYYGGWVAPNIYFLGYAGVVNFGGIRIGGLSGIYKRGDYKCGHHEHAPYTAGTMRSAYHIRELDVFRLKQLQEPLDVFLSHDWPQHIAKMGNTQQLIRHKKFLAPEIEDGSLGSPPARELLEELRPDYWFSAHLHTKFAAVVPHEGVRRPDGSLAVTKFLSLDKCLPGRRFLQVVTFPNAHGPKEVQLDEEWLGVLRSTHSLMRLTKRGPTLPGMGGSRKCAKPEDRDAVAANLRSAGPAPPPFQLTAPAFTGGRPGQGSMPRSDERNPQTLALLDSIVGVPYNLDAGGMSGPSQGLPGPPPGPPPRPPPGLAAGHDEANPEEIDLDDDDDDDAKGQYTANPEEIELDDVESEEEDAEVQASSKRPKLGSSLPPPAVS